MPAPRRIDHERVLELWHRGLSSQAIASRLGCTTRTVNRIVRGESRP